MPSIPKPVLLVVLDGFGYSPSERGNAIRDANTPNLDSIERSFPLTTLQASGVAVGLPWGEPGNSEVGHLTMGAGRPIYHHLPRIIVAIHDGTFYENPAFKKATEHVAKNDSALHIIGLASSGSVHSYTEHLQALLELATRAELKRVYLHLLADGKDASPREGRLFLARIEERIAAKHPNVEIVSVVGRFYAMDRDGQWARIRKAYELFTEAAGTPFDDPIRYLESSYAAGTFDEFVEPGYLARDGKPVGRIKANDAIIFFNFREDSMREITQAFAKEEFSSFPRRRLTNLVVATMTEYDSSLPNVAAAFPPLEIHWPLARVLAVTDKTQLHIAESEKYAHVTYFFNGGAETPFPHEDRILVPSLSVPHFDEHPEMRAGELTNRILENLGRYDFILANFANADMVGHTGNYPAIVRAVESLDAALGQLFDAILARDGAMILTGDHGNAEQKIHPYTGEAVTAHTANPVPFILVGKRYRRASPRTNAELREALREPAGILIDIAPTILALMDLPKPDEMTGRSLLATLH